MDIAKQSAKPAAGFRVAKDGNVTVTLPKLVYKVIEDPEEL